MPRMLIDNTPPTFVFQDGNQLTDGMANFGRALVQAPLAAAQIRQDQQQQALANTWRQAEIDRQTRMDDLNRVWHDQGQQRMAEQDAINRKRQAEQDALARAGLGLSVDGRPDLQPLVDEANQTRNFNQAYRQAVTSEAEARAFAMSPLGKIVGSLFGGGAKAGAAGNSNRPNAATLRAAHELADAEARRRGVVEDDEMGKRKVKDPAGWNTILKQSYDLHGIQVPQVWQDVPDKGGEASTSASDTSASDTPGMPTIPQGFWTMRRSGAHGGARTFGDVVGLRWFGAGEGGGQDQAPVVRPEALASVTATLRSGNLSPEQAKLLSSTAAAAQAGDAQAIQHLQEWYDQQPAVKDQARKDQITATAMRGALFGP